MASERADAVVEIRAAQDWYRFVERLKRPVAAAKQIAALLVKISNKAFREQRLGEFNWKPRSVFVKDARGKEWLANVAAIIADLNAGRAVPARRFEDRPALVDTNNLRRSVASSIDPSDNVMLITVGTMLPYASVHQFGGNTVSTLSSGGQAALRDWMKKTERKRTKVRKKHADEPAIDDADYAEQLEEREAADQRAGVAEGLSFLLVDPTWRQRVPQRPFVGLPDEYDGKVAKILAWNVAKDTEGEEAAA